MIYVSENIVERPVVSVLLLVYNQEAYIRQCIDGVLCQQTNFLYEIIVADDFSTDSTRSILLEYQKLYPKLFKLCFQEKNLGILENYKIGLNLCRGAYIAQCAGDDFWIDSMKLQKQYTILNEHGEIGLCYTNADMCDKRGNIIKHSWLSDCALPMTFESFLLQPRSIAPLTWMFRTNLRHLYYYEKFFVDESYVMTLEILKHSVVYFLDEVTAVYRSHTGSLSNPKFLDKKYAQHKGVFDMQLFFAQKYKMPMQSILKIKLRSFLQLLPMAMELKDEAMIGNAVVFLKENNVDTDSLISIFRSEISKRNSEAYKLGKVLTTAVKRIFFIKNK